MLNCITEQIRIQVALKAGFKQALLESVYVVVYIVAYIENFVSMNLILDLRGNSQLFKVFRVTLFHYKVIFV